MKRSDDKTEETACPEFALIAGLVEGDLDREAVETLEQHMRTCLACAATRDEVSRTVALLEESGQLLVDPPEEVEHRAVEMGRSHLRGRATGLPFQIAHLARVGPLPVRAGVRGSGGGAREFLYESQQMDLRVQVRLESGGEHRLRGHAYARTPDPVVLRRVLLRPDGGGTDLPATLRGERGFLMEHLASGRYSLVIETEDGCIHCPDLDTGIE